MLLRSGGCEFQSYFSRAAERSAPLSRGKGEADGRTRSDCASWCDDVKEVRKVWTGKVEKVG